MKYFKYTIFLFIGILLIGCIRVEDDTDTETTTPSKVVIQADKDDITILWSKNTKRYGQLEVTDDTSSVNPLATVATGESEVEITCIFIKKLHENNHLRKYTCTSQNAGTVGSFTLILPSNKSLLIIEREGKKDTDDFELLSELFIYGSETDPALYVS